MLGFIFKLFILGGIVGSIYTVLKNRPNDVLHFNMSQELKAPAEDKQSLTYAFTKISQHSTEKPTGNPTEELPSEETYLDPALAEYSEELIPDTYMISPQMSELERREQLEKIAVDLSEEQVPLAILKSISSGVWSEDDLDFLMEASSDAIQKIQPGSAAEAELAKIIDRFQRQGQNDLESYVVVSQLKNVRSDLYEFYREFIEMD